MSRDPWDLDTQRTGIRFERRANLIIGLISTFPLISARRATHSAAENALRGVNSNVLSRRREMGVTIRERFILE